MAKEEKKSFFVKDLEKKTVCAQAGTRTTDLNVSEQTPYQKAMVTDH